ncbi:ABC transporter permease [Crystallibacter degradans]|uniref:ABC transporter permease n=1 Tax=Crystallibacter degradans TaxID=2726743 RepID=UPI0014753A12|nr:ABC transporter permease [Arthrobacter sp. SF27]NMR29788.1 ABC transporter permease [Arthrobacter sp. SF27]
MDWFLANLPFVLELSGHHLYQSVLPLVLGLLISVPLGYLAWRLPSVRGVILSVSSVLYTIPSLALFVILPVILGTRILDPANLIVALTVYAIALLVRSVVDALESIDDGVRQAAVAMGYRPFRRFFAVDLPLAVPVLFAGLRVVSVSNISLASVGALIGIRNLGVLFTDGLLRHFLTEIVVGIVMTLVLALLMDFVLVGLEHLLTPWNRHRKARSKQVLVATTGPDNSGSGDSAGTARRPDAAETAVLHESL